jgi:hypothetical protein
MLKLLADVSVYNLFLFNAICSALVRVPPFPLASKAEVACTANELSLEMLADG